MIFLSQILALIQSAGEIRIDVVSFRFICIELSCAKRSYIQFVSFESFLCLCLFFAYFSINFRFVFSLRVSSNVLMTCSL